jgi:MFS family permease
MVGAPLGGFFADLLRRRTPGGRMIVQACALMVGAPFVYWAGHTPAFSAFLAAIAFWGLLKGMYDANIFAAAFDVIPPHMRGTAAGFMNMAGWLGAFPAPVIIGALAERYSLSVAISSASGIYVAAGIVMLIGVAAFARRDAAKMERALVTGW